MSLAPARPALGEVLEPFQMRSSPRLPRMLFIDCSPSTNRNASAILLLPEPFGPTIAVIAVANCSGVFFANDLKPESSIDVSRINSLYCIKKQHPVRMSMRTGSAVPALLKNVGQRDFNFSHATQCLPATVMRPPVVETVGKGDRRSKIGDRPAARLSVVIFLK